MTTSVSNRHFSDIHLSVKGVCRDGEGVDPISMLEQDSFDLDLLPVLARYPKTLCDATERKQCADELNRGVAQETLIMMLIPKSGASIN